MNEILKNNTYRHVISIIFSVIVALIVGFFWSKMDCGLIPLTTLYVMQTSVGHAFYQGMRRLFFVLIILTAAALLVFSVHFFYYMAHDVVIGAVIGIIGDLVFLPRKPDQEFRENVLPIVQACNHYFSVIIDQLLQQGKKPSNNAEIEIALTKLPDWVYQRGFDRFLQKGYQFFLIKLEQITDVLFSMHRLSRYEYDKELIAKIRPALLQYVDNVNQFFLSIVAVLELKKLTEEPGDLTDEIEQLQKQFFNVVPASLELLDIRRDYAYLAAFIYNLKDLRRFLLKLGEALR